MLVWAFSRAPGTIVPRRRVPFVWAAASKIREALAKRVYTRGTPRKGAGRVGIFLLLRHSGNRQPQSMSFETPKTGKTRFTAEPQRFASDD